MNGLVRKRRAVTNRFSSKLLTLALLIVGWLPTLELCAATGTPDLRAEAFGILFLHCWECHNARHNEGGLRLDSLAWPARAGGFSGKVAAGARGGRQRNFCRRVNSDDHQSVFIERPRAMRRYGPTRSSSCKPGWLRARPGRTSKLPAGAIGENRFRARFGPGWGAR